MTEVHPLNTTYTTAGVPAVRSQELDRYARLGKWLAASESGAKDPDSLGAAAALRLFYVHELGLPLRAASEANVINGKFSGSATLHRALAEKGGYRVEMREGSNHESCTADLIRLETGEVIGSATFTMADAERAGLEKGVNWQKYPARMLWARASKYVVQDYAPAIAIGLMLDDEIPEVTGVWSDGSGGASVPGTVAASPDGSVEEPTPAGVATPTEEAPGKPPLAPAPGASPEPTYPGLGFPRHAEGWMLMEDEWDNICESLNHDSPGEAQRLVDRWAELDHDAEAAIKTVKASDDTRVLHLFADREARANGRVTVLRAIQKRLEKLTLPLPESLQPASALTRLQALIGWVKENPGSVPKPKAYTEYGLLQAIKARELGHYMLLDQASDETLEHFWLQVPENLRLVIEGLPAQEVTRLADGA